MWLLTLSNFDIICTYFIVLYSLILSWLQYFYLKNILPLFIKNSNKNQITNNQILLFFSKSFSISFSFLWLIKSESIVLINPLIHMGN